MSSDKCNSIMAIASYRLDFFTVQLRFVWRHAFLPTAAASMLASWFYIPKFTFVLHSFLSYSISFFLSPFSMVVIGVVGGWGVEGEHNNYRSTKWNTKTIESQRSCLGPTGPFPCSQHSKLKITDIGQPFVV